ncbi:hypothetical protein AM593_03136, partial [Mytilus galloprovincialis]
MNPINNHRRRETSSISNCDVSLALGNIQLSVGSDHQMAQSACMGLAQDAVYPSAIPRACSGGKTCESICADATSTMNKYSTAGGPLSTARCVNAFHIYTRRGQEDVPSQPFVVSWKYGKICFVQQRVNQEQDRGTRGTTYQNMILCGKSQVITTLLKRLYHLDLDKYILFDHLNINSIVILEQTYRWPIPEGAQHFVLLIYFQMHDGSPSIK